MQLLRRRSAFSARGPIPPWWRRPGVLAVVGLLVVGAGLAASDSVVSLFETRHVRETTAAVRQLPLPSGMTAWAPACGLYGMKCAQTDLGSANAVEAVADLVRQTGLELPAARCGDGQGPDPVWIGALGCRCAGQAYLALFSRRRRCRIGSV